MVRKYKSTKIKAYTEDDLDLAIELVKTNEDSIHSAATKFNIPYSTLASPVKGTVNSKKPGKQTLLSKEEEEALVEALVYLADCGFGLNLIVFKNVVNTYIQKLGIFNIFILKKISIKRIFVHKISVIFLVDMVY